MQKQKLSFNSIKAVIFDMDGTMVDNNEFHKKAFQEFCKRHGKTLTDEEYMKKFSGRSNKQVMPLVFGKDLTEEEFHRYDDEKESIYRDMYADHIKPIEGLHEFLDKLAERGIKIAMATGSPHKNRKFIIDALNLEKVFDAIVGGEEIKRGKPEPDAFLTAAKKLKVPPSNCVVFEDAPPGITAAKRAGMKVVGLLTSYSREDFKEADLIIENFTQIDI